MSKNFKSKVNEVYTTPIPLIEFKKDELTTASNNILQGNFISPPVVRLYIIAFFAHVKMTDDILKGDIIHADTMPRDFAIF